jgi:hypothetical protein
LGNERVARPIQEVKHALVFSRNAFASGPGNAGNSTGGTHATLKVNGAKANPHFSSCSAAKSLLPINSKSCQLLLFFLSHDSA